MYYVLKVVTTSPADMAHLLMVYAPWGILVGFLLARARLALARRTPPTTVPPAASPPADPPTSAAESPPLQETTAPDPPDEPEPKKTEGDAAGAPADPPLPPPASPPPAKAAAVTEQPKPASSPKPDTPSKPVADTSREPSQVTSPTDTSPPPELKAFTDALRDIKAYIDDKSKIMMEVKNLMDGKSTQEIPPASTTDVGAALDAALKPLSETLSTIDSTTAGSSRDLSNHVWECGGRHQATDGTLSAIHNMVRDLQNRVGTTQRKLDDWVKSWSDSTGTMDDPPGVTKCLCQLREVQDELSRSNQGTEALTQKVDSVTESIGSLSTRVQSMQTLLDKMAAARPKPKLRHPPFPHLTSLQPRPPGPHRTSPLAVGMLHHSPRA